MIIQLHPRRIPISPGVCLWKFDSRVDGGSLGWNINELL